MRGVGRPVPTVALAGFIGIFLAVGGLGYAACTGGPGSNGGGTHGTISLIWTPPESTIVTASYVHCSATYATTVLTLRVTDLAPGTGCALLATLKNTGTLPTSLEDKIALTQPPGCAFFSFSDNVHGLVKGPVVSAGGSFGYHATLSLSPAASNACEGKTASLLVTITGGGPCAAPWSQWGCY